MTNELATITYTNDQIDLIKRTICVGSTNDEFMLFVQQCKRTGLDPFARQIYAIKRPVKGGGSKMTIQVGIDGFRLIANRTGEADGQDGPYWCGVDGVWRDMWPSDNPPVAAKVTVFRKGQSRGYIGIAHMSEYYQQAGGMWDKLPVTMLAKVAESIALRKAFPQELSGIYTDDEMPPEPSPETPRTQALPATPVATTPVDKGELRKQLERTGWGWKKCIKAMNFNDGTSYDPEAAQPSEINQEQLGVFLAWLCTQPDKPAPAQAQPATEPAQAAPAATTAPQPAEQAQPDGDNW